MTDPTRIKRGTPEEIDLLYVDRAYRSGNLADAWSRLCNLAARFPQDPSLAAWLGKVAYTRGEYDLASRQLGFASTSAPTSLFLSRRLFLALLRSGRYSDAVDEVYRFLELWPDALSYRSLLRHVSSGILGTQRLRIGDPAEAKLHAAELAYRMHDLDEAERVISELRALGADDERVLGVDGLIALRKRRPGRALRLFRRATTFDPRDQLWSLGVFISYWRLGRRAEAIVEMDRYLYVWPDAPEYRQVRIAVDKFRDQSTSSVAMKTNNSRIRVGLPRNPVARYPPPEARDVWK